MLKFSSTVLSFCSLVVTLARFRLARSMVIGKLVKEVVVQPVGDTGETVTKCVGSESLKLT